MLAHQLGQPVEELRVRLAQRRAADVVPRDQRAHVLGVDLEAELLEGGAELLHVDRRELRRVVVRKHLAHALGARLWQQLALLVRDQVAHEVGVLGEVQRRRVVLVVPLQDGGGAGVLHAHRVERARQLGGVDRPRLVGVEAVERLLVRLGREGGERPLRLLRRHQVARQLRKLLRVDTALRAVAERLAVLGDRRAHVVGVARHAHRVERARELAPLDEPRAVGVEPVEGDGAPLDRRERGGRLLLLKRDDVAHERRKLADVEAARLLPRPALVLGHHVARAREVDVDAQQVERLPQLADVERPRLVGIELVEGGAQPRRRQLLERRTLHLRRHHLLHEVGKLRQVERRRARVVHVVAVDDPRGARVLHSHRVERPTQLARVDRARAVGVEAVEGGAVRLRRHRGERRLGLLRRDQISRQVGELGAVELLALAVLGHRRLHVVRGDPHLRQRRRELARVDRARVVRVEPPERRLDAVGRRQPRRRLLLLVRDDVAHERRELFEVEAAARRARRRDAAAVPVERRLRRRRVGTDPQQLDGAAEVGGGDAALAARVVPPEGGLDLRRIQVHLLALLPPDEVAHQRREGADVEPLAAARALVVLLEHVLGAGGVDGEAQSVERRRELLELDPTRLVGVEAVKRRAELRRAQPRERLGGAERGELVQ